MSEESEPTAQPDELGAHRPDRRAACPSGSRHRLEVRGEPPDQPHQLDIALRFPFQPPARLHAVEIAVEVDQQRLGWYEDGRSLPVQHPQSPIPPNLIHHRRHRQCGQGYLPRRSRPTRQQDELAPVSTSTKRFIPPPRTPRENTRLGVFTRPTPKADLNRSGRAHLSGRSADRNTARTTGVCQSAGLAANRRPDKKSSRSSGLR